ncbi:MAG: methyltransferase domain-containing protein [Terriglobales bacterium]
MKISIETTKPRNWVGLADQVLAILRCLSCQGTLRQEETGLTCMVCQRQYPVVKGVVRFVDAQHYAGSFGFQWLTFRDTQLDNEQSRRSESDFRRRTGFTPEELAGKLVLDVGCGMGRFAEVATRWGAYVVGIDLSLAEEAATENLRDREAVFFQVDVFHLPFAPQSFDYIYSIRVLHHTPNCEQAFKVLPGLLKPGGRIAIWLYSGYNKWYRMSDLYRKVTRRMSPKTVYRLAHITVPMYGVHQFLRSIPLLGKPTSGVMKYLLPMSFNPDPQWRVLDTLDWYSPWYQSKHSYEEVFRWFEDCGLQDLRVILQPISVQGQRPLQGVGSENSEKSEVDRCAG